MVYNTTARPPAAVAAASAAAAAAAAMMHCGIACTQLLCLLFSGDDKSVRNIMNVLYSCVYPKRQYIYIQKNVKACISAHSKRRQALYQGIQIRADRRPLAAAAGAASAAAASAAAAPPAAAVAAAAPAAAAAAAFVAGADAAFAAAVAAAGPGEFCRYREIGKQNDRFGTGKLMESARRPPTTTPLQPLLLLLQCLLLLVAASAVPVVCSEMCVHECGFP